MHGTVAEVLTAARWILANVGWTKRAFARDKRGEALWARGNWNDLAVCFCARGAVYATTFDSDSKTMAAVALDAAVTDGDCGNGVAGFNDRQRSVAPVLALFDRVIRAEAGK